jgi:hypothetical protein
LAASSKAQVSSYIDRVESKSNVADGPSRLDLEFVLAWRALFTLPCVDLVQSPPQTASPICGLPVTNSVGRGSPKQRGEVGPPSARKDSSKV